jgi:hypothetical protein
MLETNYTLSLGHLFKIAIELKRYLGHKLKSHKTQNLSITTTNKQACSLVPEVGTIVVAKDNHMKIIQVQIGKNIYNRRCVTRWRFWS